MGLRPVGDADLIGLAVIGSDAPVFGVANADTAGTKVRAKDVGVLAGVVQATPVRCAGVAVAAVAVLLAASGNRRPHARFVLAGGGAADRGRAGGAGGPAVGDLVVADALVAALVEAGFAHDAADAIGAGGGAVGPRAAGVGARPAICEVDPDVRLTARLGITVAVGEPGVALAQGAGAALAGGGGVGEAARLSARPAVRRVGLEIDAVA